MRQSGFTLIELLVVITIIVVLLALLTPALDRTIYQAELTVCQANLHAIAGGTVTYSANHKRYYFYRLGVRDPNIGYYQPRSLNVPFNSSQTSRSEGYDDRPMMAPYFDLNKLVCPPAGEVTIASSKEGTYNLSSYAIWAGWKYRHENAGSGMFKLGNRMTHRYDIDLDASNGAETTHRFKVLAGDLCDVIWSGWENAHPDSKGILQQTVKQDEDWPPQDRGTRADPDAKTTQAGWIANVFDFPGTVDMNFVYDDMSVVRLSEMYWDPRDHGEPWGEPEPRTWPLPSFVDTHPDNFNLLTIAK